MLIFLGLGASKKKKGGGQKNEFFFSAQRDLCNKKDGTNRSVNVSKGEKTIKKIYGKPY
jgi:hypothetical protein